MWAPVHQATVGAAGGTTNRGSGWTKPESFVGNGPFTLTEWKPNEIIRIEKSPTYWNADAVRLHAVVYHAFDSGDTEERAFRAQQLHRTERVPVAKLPGYREQTDSPLRETPSLISTFINFNITRPPFDDERVRRAFALAIDRDKLAEVVYLHSAAPARRVVPNGITGYPEEDDFQDDVTAAQALLAAAGYPGGSGFPVAQLSIESGRSQDLPQALQARWRQVLGVPIEIVASESRVHWSSLQQGDFTLAIGGWIADYPDATAFLDLWKTDSGWNFTSWNSANYDAALATAASASDSAVRVRLMRQAESLLMQAMPIIPIVFPKTTTLVHPSVRDFQDNAMDRPDYRTVILR